MIETKNLTEIDYSLWQDRYNISGFGMDMKCKATLQLLCHYFWESARNHVYTIHDQTRVRGWKKIFTRDELWLLSRLFIKIDKYPCWNENIYVRTWSKCYDRLFSIRDFQIIDEKGEVLGAATTAWILVNINSRKPVRLEKLEEKVVFLQDKHGINKKLDKIDPLKNPVFLNYFPVKYSDLDLNNHVNNIKYIDWILDSYPFEFRNEYEVKSFEINYLSELFYGDEICIGTDIRNDNLCFAHNALRRKDNKDVMRAVIEWQQEKDNYPRKRRR